MITKNHLKIASDSSEINEGPSTEEKECAMLNLLENKIKYRNVDLTSGIQDQINPSYGFTKRY